MERKMDMWRAILVYTGINVNDSIMMRECLVSILMSSLLHVCCSQNLRLPLTSNHR